MKKISILLLLFVTVFFAACEKDKENVVIKETISANAINALSASSFTLLMDNASQTFQTFKWTAVDYGFSAATTYTVQADVKGNSFASAIDVVSSDTLKASISVGDFNKLLLNAGLDPEVAVILQFRVKAFINASVPVVYSNAVEATVTPYATTFPPIYMCGGAVGGWGWALYQYKELRSTAPSIYSTIAYFVNNDIFRFFKQTDWGPTSWNYNYFTTVTPLLTLNTGDSDNNFKVVGASGYYQVTVNMKTKAVTMEAVADQTMFMTGAGVGNGNWDWSTNTVTMTWLSNGIYRATANFINGGAFRFFAQAGWSPTSYNYPYFDGGSVTDKLVNADDGDKNFKVTATTGSYVITVNIIDKVVTMEVAP